MITNAIISTLSDAVRKVEDSELPVCMDITTAVACAESEAAKSAMEDVEETLEQRAEAIIPDEQEPLEVKEKNIYTRLTLDESLEDFSIDLTPSGKEIEEDDYLDYDMFDFCYGIVTDDWPKPKNPLDHPIRKFMHTGSDDYIGTNSNKGVEQVSTDYNGNVVVYSDAIDDFNDAIAVCKHYNIKVGNPVPSKSDKSRWNYSLTIYVPTTSDGYPMMAEDFFAEQGLTLADVIEDHKVGGGKSANWGKTYQKNVERDRNDAVNLVNDDAVEEIYKKWYLKAANSNDPIEDFVKGLFADLDSESLSYSKSKLKKRFISDFEDDFDDEE